MLYSRPVPTRRPMARTDLLMRLQQLYGDFHEAELSGKPVSVIQEERLHSRRSRRESLKVPAGAAAAAAVAHPARLFAGPTPRIVIVGGGIAGLNAALTLQDAGYASTIYEASSRI